MPKKLGVLMDPISLIHYKKDSTLAMLWEAQKRGFELYYFEQEHLFFNKTVAVHAQKLTVFQDEQRWYQLQTSSIMQINDFDVILMRKDPPFNIKYIYTTYFLDHAAAAGVLVINHPQALRDVNEKIYTSWFPECCPPTLMTADIASLKAFLAEHKAIVCKPPEGMGGASVFYLQYPDQNASVVFELLTQHGQNYVVAQQYIPEIKLGDKRVLLINGIPIPYGLSRIPQAGELRGNLAAGGKGVAMPLTAEEQAICDQIGPTLRDKGLYFVGLDIIGNYLTEINVTSPTCIREIDQQANTNIASTLFDFIENKI